MKSIFLCAPPIHHQKCLQIWKTFLCGSLLGATNRQFFENRELLNFLLITFSALYVVVNVGKLIIALLLNYDFALCCIGT